MSKVMAAGENKMGVMPIKKLIVTMSLPMMASMLVQALYNIVDSMFVAQLSEDALTAVTLAFPVQNLMISVASGTGVGVNALLSRSLGEKNQNQVDKSAGVAIFLAMCSYLLFVILGIFAVGPFMNFQTSSTEIAALGTTYTSIVCCVSIGIFFQVALERLLQATGRTVYSMISQITGAVVNMILDPILIFGLLGAPKLGVAGAAIATVIGQMCGALVALQFNLRKNKDINFNWRAIIKPDLHTIGKVYAVGIPSIIMMSIGSVMTSLMNIILGRFSSTAVAVFGAYFKLQSFFFMPVFGLNNGVVPVLAFNLGAKQRQRIDEAIKFVLVLAVSIMVVGLLIFETIPATLLQIFNASDEMLEIGVPALRIIALHYPIAALGMALGSVFQAFSKSIYSLIVSLCRQLVALIPAAYLLSLTGNINNVWWCFIIAEVVSATVSLISYRIVYRQTMTF